MINLLKRMFRAADVRPYTKPDPMIEVDAALSIKAANQRINESVAQLDGLPPVTHRRTSKAGVALIHGFESLAKVRADGMVDAYPDPGSGGDPWTIGWGATGIDPFNGGRIKRGTVWTQEQCGIRFEQHLALFEQSVRATLGKAPVTQPQFDALVSFAYNLGGKALAGSTLMRLHKAGDYPGAAKQFLRWNKAAGKVMRGLTRRRTAEAELYRSGS